MKWTSAWLAQKTTKEKRRTKKIWVRNLFYREGNIPHSIAVLLRWEYDKFFFKIEGEKWKQLEADTVIEAKQQAEALAIALRRMS
jgi:hypothetical protein